MKIKLLIKIIAGIAISTATLNVYSAVEASSDKYSCQAVNGVYGIYSRTERSNIGLLKITRDVSQDWSIPDRCQEIAQRFQRFYDNGILRKIGTGEVNQEPVLCATVQESESCNTENVLLTLPPGSDPIEAARILLDTRGLASGRVIEVNGKEGKLENYVDGRAYYDLEVLEKLILESANGDRLISN